MKTMTCQQLGGACDEEFHAESFEEIAELSQKHGMLMYREQNPAHLKAMQDMQELMKNPVKIQQWFALKQQEFDNLPER